MKSQLKHTKPIYYTAGLISLIMLPILCIWNLDNNKAFEKQHVLELLWWSKDRKDQQFDVHPSRKFDDTYLTSDNNSNKIKLDASQLKIRKLIATNDTINGVHFIFDNNSKYWTLVKVIDICNVEGAEHFILKDNDLWVCNYVPRPMILMDYPVKLSGPMDCVPYFETEEQIAEAKAENIKYILETGKQYSLSIIIFSILVFLAIRRIYFNNKTLIKYD
ncbi:MAG: hypothetical protein V4547_14230 [Bacteroidota bacterium]